MAHKLWIQTYMNYVFLVPKKSIRGLKNVISSQFLPVYCQLVP